MISPPPPQSSTLRHVLVVEDSPLHQRLASGLLAQRGLDVTLANNGEEAVAATRLVQFDLILMDIEMPVLDGCAATRQIRDQEIRGKRVPIIAVTSREDHHGILDAGADAAIVKPLTSSRLDEILQNLAPETVDSRGPLGN